MDIKGFFAIALFFFTLNGSAAWAEGDVGPYTQALKNFRSQPATQPFFAEAVGYAIFPTIGKGGIGIGGAYGPGRVYKHGAYVGDVKMGQISIGWQFGGQAYSEIVFFENKAAMDKFKKGDVELSAQASAVAVTKGVAAKTDFKNGFAIFTMTKGGLMYEASVAGQNLSFKKK